MNRAPPPKIYDAIEEDQFDNQTQPNMSVDCASSDSSFRSRLT